MPRAPRASRSPSSPRKRWRRSRKKPKRGVLVSKTSRKCILSAAHADRVDTTERRYNGILSFLIQRNLLVTLCQGSSRACVRSVFLLLETARFTITPLHLLCRKDLELPPKHCVRFYLPAAAWHLTIYFIFVPLARSGG